MPWSHLEDWTDSGLSLASPDLPPSLQELAEKLHLDSYRRLTCSHIILDPAKLNAGERKTFEGAEWVDNAVKRTSLMGSEETIAQVCGGRR